MKIQPIVTRPEFLNFIKSLENNKGTCICSLDYNNEDMKCICKKFRESKTGEMCDCSIYIKTEE